MNSNRFDITKMYKTTVSKDNYTNEDFLTIEFFDPSFDDTGFLYFKNKLAGKFIININSNNIMIWNHKFDSTNRIGCLYYNTVDNKIKPHIFNKLRNKIVAGAYSNILSRIALFSDESEKTFGEMIVLAELKLLKIIELELAEAFPDKKQGLFKAEYYEKDFLI